MQDFIKITNGKRDIRTLMKALRSGYTLRLDKVYIEYIKSDKFKVRLEEEYLQNKFINYIHIKNVRWVRMFLKKDFLSQEIYQNLI